MKTFFYALLFVLLLAQCTEKKNSEEFINKTTGRYLFNANEVIEIRFEDGILLAEWRGKENIQPVKVNDSTFYMAEMNEKFIFLDHPARIELAEKTEHEGVKYIFEKLAKDEKTPNEYLAEDNFEMAVKAYQRIKEKDSLNPLIQEYRINRLGYQLIRDKKIDRAIQVLTVNTILYPNKSNTFDSLGNAFWIKKDTAEAVKNYKKALKINPENRSALLFFKKHKLE